MESLSPVEGQAAGEPGGTLGSREEGRIGYSRRQEAVACIQAGRCTTAPSPAGGEKSLSRLATAQPMRSQPMRSPSPAWQQLSQ